MFVSQLHVSGSRPSFFEMLAQQRLVPSLKPAARFVLTLAAERNHALLPTLERFDLLWAAGITLLEQGYLSSHCASFAENFYGLRRHGRGPNGDLTDLQRAASLAVLAGVPLVKDRLDAWCRANTSAVSSLAQGDGADSAGADSSAASDTDVARRRWVRLYAWLHTLYELVHLVYIVLYLYNRSRYFSPWQHLLGYDVRRITTEDLRAAQRSTPGVSAAADAAASATPAATASSLSRTGAVASHPGLLRRVAALLQRTPGYHALRRVLALARYTLPAAIFAFKFLEWWYSSSGQTGTTAALPVPPAPTPAPPRSASYRLPSDKSLCPLCLRVRSNATAAPSGYVFCYPCILQHAQRHHECPITGQAVQPDQLLRIYENR